MIKTFEVKKLNGKISDKYYLNDDLNILTGKNGCGKTTILKLMWYLVSGNYDKLFDEMMFDFARIEMTEGGVIEMDISEEKGTKYLNLKIINVNRNVDVSVNLSFDNISSLPRYQTLEGSLFFPTFRRIEGGFAITSDTSRIRLKRNTLRDALESISESLTFGQNHKFIA